LWKREQVNFNDTFTPPAANWHCGKKDVGLVKLAVFIYVQATNIVQEMITSHPKALQGMKVKTMFPLVRYKNSANQGT